MRYPKLSTIVKIILACGLFSFFGISCGINVSDVQGLYAGALSDLNGKTSEFFVQLYGNGQYAMRRTVYEDGVRSNSRSGSWSILGLTIILTADGEKDLRFVFERNCLRLEASNSALSALPFDQVSLQRIGP